MTSVISGEVPREQHLAEAMTAPGPEVGGLQLRKPSIGSLLLLRKTGNRLFSADGKMAEVDETNLLEFADDLVGFIFIHAAPIEEVTRLCHGPREDFERKLSEFALELDGDKLPELLGHLHAESAAIGAAQVSPEPESEPEGTDDPNASGRSGTRA